MKKTLAIAVAALALTSSLAQANVVLSVLAGQLTKADGITSLPIGSTLALIVDNGNNGFGDLTQATSSFSPGADDLVLGRQATNEDAAPGLGSYTFAFDL